MRGALLALSFFFFGGVYVEDELVVKMPEHEVTKIMVNGLKRDVLKTSGFVLIGVGIYFVYRSSKYDNIIDAKFEVIEDD